MKSHKAKTALVLILLALSACTASVFKGKESYIGEWTSPTMTLRINRSGVLIYERPAMNNRVEAYCYCPILEMNDHSIVAGVRGDSSPTVFEVNNPPHKDGESWKMTIDEVELVRR